MRLKLPMPFGNENLTSLNESLRRGGLPVFWRLINGSLFRRNYNLPMSKEASILVVDDEREIADLVVEILRREGFRAVPCYSGEQALELFARQTFDLVVLDVMMPGMDGLETCGRLRAVSNVPIVFLSAKAEEADKVVGLMLGGDDYVAKPFGRRELVARVRARLRRFGAEDVGRSDVLEARGIEIDTASHVATLHGEKLSLTPKEYEMLLLLLKSAGRPVSTSQMYEAVWGKPFCDAAANSVMVHIRRLRMKLAEIDGSETFIETAWGVGYRISPSVKARR